MTTVSQHIIYTLFTHYLHSRFTDNCLRTIITDLKLHRTPPFTSALERPGVWISRVEAVRNTVGEGPSHRRPGGMAPLTRQHVTLALSV
jgi:hypothetical protein